MSSELVTFASLKRANAKILTLFVYSGEKDKRSLLKKRAVYRRIGEGRPYTARYSTQRGVALALHRKRGIQP